MPVSFAEALCSAAPSSVGPAVLGQTKTSVSKHRRLKESHRDDLQTSKRSNCNVSKGLRGSPATKPSPIRLLSKPPPVRVVKNDSPTLDSSSKMKPPSTLTRTQATPANAECNDKLVDKRSQSIGVKQGEVKPQLKESRNSLSERSSSLLTSFGAKQRSAEEINQMGIFLSDQTTIKKGRNFLGPRKKKFSVLKKKILQERLAQWNATEDANQLTLTEEQIQSTTVALLNYCTPDELEDLDELEEILTNLKEMSAKVGNVEDIHVDQVRGHAFCRFETSREACAAQACWNGLVLGGNRLCTKLIYSLPTDRPWRLSVESCLHEGEEGAQDATVVLENVLTSDDLEDSECLQESLEDIKQMAMNTGVLRDVSVENQDQVVLTFQGKHNAISFFNGRVIGGQVVTARLRTSVVTSVVLLNVLTDEDQEDKDCLEESLHDLRILASEYGVVTDLRLAEDRRGAVVVEYEGNVAQKAASHLNSHIIGGRSIQAEVFQPEPIESHTILLYNLLTDIDCEDEECLAETKDDIAELAGRYGKVTRIDVDLKHRVVKLEYKDEIRKLELAVERLNHMVLGGQAISAVFLTDETANPTKGLKGLDHSGNSKEAHVELLPLYSGKKLIPERFAQMKRVPKVANSGIPMPYATLLNDETVKPLLIEMLNELMRLQKRAVEECNTKAKRRLVIGLREVARGIRSRKVKLVVMANNLDQYGALDEKLQEIIEIAKDNGVPIFYEFSKRGLGKAIAKNIKIGVIGVQNADGAQQQFKKLISIATAHGLS